MNEVFDAMMNNVEKTIEGDGYKTVSEIIENVGFAGEYSHELGMVVITGEKRRFTHGERQILKGFIEMNCPDYKEMLYALV